MTTASISRRSTDETEKPPLPVHSPPDMLKLLEVRETPGPGRASPGSRSRRLPGQIRALSEDVQIASVCIPPVAPAAAAFLNNALIEQELHGLGRRWT